MPTALTIDRWHRSLIVLAPRGLVGEGQDDESSGGWELRAIGTTEACGPAVERHAIKD
jgi:hypothetical protein